MQENNGNNMDANIARPRAKEERNHKEKEQQFVFEAGLHELKNLLTASQACLQTISLNLEKKATPELDSSRRFLEVSLKQHTLMTESVAALLAYTRFGEGGVVARKEAWPVKPLVDHAVRQLAGLAQLHEVTIQAEVADALPLIRVDGQFYIRILVNLMTNAIRHLKKENRLVIVSAGLGEPQWLLTQVRDYGEGLPPELLKVLFEKQLPSAETGGHGLGLYLCRMFVEKLGGRIWVENSAGPAEPGTTFSFTVPLA